MRSVQMLIQKMQLPQQSRFHCGQRPKHQNRQQTIGQNAEHRQQAQQEQCAVQGQLPGLPQGLRVHRRDLEIPGQDRQGRRGQAGQTDPRQGQHHREKIPGRESIGPVKVEVLGIAHRRHHTAQIRSSRLQDNDPDAAFLVPDVPEQQQRQRHKGEQCHIIGHQHGAEKAQLDEKQSHTPHRPGTFQQVLRHLFKHADAAQSCHCEHETKQLDQYSPVAVGQIAGIRRHKTGLRLSRQNFRPRKGVLGRILKIGLPVAVQDGCIQVAFIIITIIANHRGLIDSAAVGIVEKIISFLFLVPSSMLSTVSALAAQNIGAGKKSRAWKGFYTAIITGCSVGIIIFMVGFFGGGVLSSFFTNDSEVIAQSAAYLKGFSADCILTCVLFSSIGYFNGCGKSIPVMIQGITSAFCIRIPVSIIMSRLPETSLTYVGMATPITTVYGIIFFVICFRLLNKNAAK